MNSQRNLTDEDVQAILDAFEDRFYTNLGKGLWGMVWKVLIVAIVGVAAYGAIYHK